jgi:23S rRNA (uracil1939-C5)-methyltransferase
MGYYHEEPHKIPIFVRYTTPGDTVRTRLVSKEKLSYEGELQEVLQEAPSRQTPQCRHFAECGACDWLHIRYEGLSVLHAPFY